MKDNIVSNKNDPEKDRILKRESELARTLGENVCLTVRVRPWQVKTNENSMCTSGGWKEMLWISLSVEARWTVTRVHEQTEKKRKGKNDLGPQLEVRTSILNRWSKYSFIVSEAFFKYRWLKEQHIKQSQKTLKNLFQPQEPIIL